MDDLALMGDDGKCCTCAVLLRDLVAEVRALRHDLAQRRSGPRPSPADMQLLAGVLPLIAARVGGRAFSVRELVAHSTLPTEGALRAALAAIGAPTQIGRLFRRASGIDVAGLTVHAIGRDRDGLTYMVG